MRKKISLSFIVYFLFLAFCALKVFAYVAPTSTTASSVFSVCTPAKTINSSGWPGDGTHSTNYLDMWLSNGTTVSDQWIVFDLGAEYNLSSMSIWNYNQVNYQEGYGRGIKTTDVLVAGNDGIYTNLGSYTFIIAPGNDTTDFEDILPLIQNGVRYVKFEIESNFSGSAYVGLSEVRFNENTIPNISIKQTDNVIEINQSLTMDATVSWYNGGNGDESYTWTVTDKPAGSTVTFSPSANVEDTVISCDTLGNYTLQLNAADPGKGDANEIVTVMVPPIDTRINMDVELDYAESELSGFEASLLLTSLIWQGYPDDVRAIADNFPIWTSYPGDTSNVELVFDLNKIYGLDYLRIWNANYPGLTNRGVKNLEVYVSDSNGAGASWTQAATVVLNEGIATTEEDFSQLIPLNSANGRYVKLNCVDNYGNPTYMSMAGVAFYSSNSVRIAPAPNCSDTWVAVDGLGFELPDYEECGPPRGDKVVGIAWMNVHVEGAPGPYDITKILENLVANPSLTWEQAGGGPRHSAHHWGEPEAGYYISTDKWVIRRNISMLIDAGVDVLIFEATNGIVFEEEYMLVCKILREMSQTGIEVPKMCFWVNNNGIAVVESLYDTFYSKDNYSELWYYWQGKPLVLGPLTGYNTEVQNFFTFRFTWAWDAGQHQWTFVDTYPQDYAWDVNSGIPEQVSVTPALHPTNNVGKSNNGTQPALDAYDLPVGRTEGDGLYFSMQLGRAIDIDPSFVFVTEWNEWGAGRYICGLDTCETFLGSPTVTGQTYFVDQYNAEYNRDIEPMKGGYTDNYYYQMTDFIRRYKGVRAPQTVSRAKTISIDGYFSDWANVTPNYKDIAGDTFHRDHPGYGTLHYTNYTGRNDFLNMKVARDNTYVYFYVQTVDTITSYTDPNWMLLFIDADQNKFNGWQGYDFLVNYQVNSSNSTTLMLTTGGWNWTSVNSNISYQVNGNELEIRIPRTDLGFSTGSGNVSIDFHWADNIQSNNDIIEFAVSGDSAPNRRFMYRYATQNYITPTSATASTALTNYPASKTIDGSGWPGDGTHHDNAVYMWICDNNNAPNDEWIVFDLGAQYDLASMSIWNFNQANNTNRGIKTADVSVSTDGITYSPPVSYTFSEAPGNATTGFEEVHPLFYAGVRYVKIEVTADYGGDGYVGLSEVRFSPSPYNKPTSVTVSSAFPGLPAVNTINGSGWPGDGTHSDNFLYMWLSDGTTVSNQWIIFDLGAEYDLSSMSIWNYNQVNYQEGYGRGIQTADVLVAGADGVYTDLGEFTFAIAPGNATTDFEDTHSLVQNGVRYVKFEITSNYSGSAYVGLSEVRFTKQ